MNANREAMDESNSVLWTCSIMYWLNDVAENVDLIHTDYIFKYHNTMGTHYIQLHLEYLHNKYSS